MTAHARRVDSVSRSPRAAEWLPGLALGIAYGALAFRSRLPQGATLLDLFAVAGVFCLVIAWLGSPWGPLAASFSRRRILAFAALFHVIGWLGAPVLEDDPARYLLDGWVFAEFGSPYGRPPADFFDTDVPPDVAALLDEVNHPEIPTIYGPTLAWLFRGAHAMAGTALWPIRLVVALASLGLLGLVARRASPLALLFVAWHPLVVKEFAFTGHPDVIAVVLLLAAERTRRAWPWLGGALLGLAIGAKIFAVLALPWILGRSWRAAGACGLMLLALYGPFAASLLPASLETPSPHLSMGLDWVFNAPLYLVLQPVFGAVPVRVGIGLAFGAWLVWLWRTTAARNTETDAEPALPGDRLFGALLLILPVLNAWYVIWPLAYWTRRPRAALAAASIAVLASYAQGLHLGRTDLDAYELPLGLVAFECGFVALAFAFDRGWSRDAGTRERTIRDRA